MRRFVAVFAVCAVCAGFALTGCSGNSESRVETIGEITSQESVEKTLFTGDFTTCKIGNKSFILGEANPFESDYTFYRDGKNGEKFYAEKSENVSLGDLQYGTVVADGAATKIIAEADCADVNAEHGYKFDAEQETSVEFAYGLHLGMPKDDVLAVLETVYNAPYSNLVIKKDEKDSHILVTHRVYKNDKLKETVCLDISFIWDGETGKNKGFIPRVNKIELWKV